MISWSKRHPLAVIIIAAVLLRLLAAFFSQGFMAHDDYYETVRIALGWQNEGILQPDGTLRWEGKPDIGVQRSATYNLFLLGLLKITSLCGVQHLDQQMYFNRFIHALLSLLPVIFGYRYLREETDKQTAIIGGLLLSGHFLLPYLSVRNLVEMAAADLLLPAFYFAHRSAKRQSDSDAIIGGVLSALAFIVRMPVAMSLAVVPAAMIVVGKKWRPALIYLFSLITVILLQGLLDFHTHGRYLGSVLSTLQGFFTGEPTLPGPWYRYLLLILGVMIPPFSILFLSGIFNLQVIKKHFLLWLPLIAFVVGHSIIVNKQERFLIPILPLLIVVGCIGYYYWASNIREHQLLKKLTTALWVWFIILNIPLLVIFTFNYAHRGAVEPLVYLSRQNDVHSVLFDSSEQGRFIPYEYWSYSRPNAITVQSREELEGALAGGRISKENPPRYVVVFTDDKLAEHVDFLQHNFGSYIVVFHGRPSLVDALLNKMNPKYNRRNESWVLKLQ